MNAPETFDHDSARTVGPSGSFPCPQCGGKTMVVNSRPAPNVHGIRRRRYCRDCKARTTTYEMAGPPPGTDHKKLAVLEAYAHAHKLLQAYLKPEEWDEL